MFIYMEKGLRVAALGCEPRRSGVCRGPPQPARARAVHSGPRAPRALRPGATALSRLPGAAPPGKQERLSNFIAVSILAKHFLLSTFTENYDTFNWDVTK